MRTDLPALLLAASLAAAGCASRSVPPPLPGSGSHWEPDNSPGPPWAEEEGQETEPPDLGDAQGIAGIVFHAPVAKGDVLVEGTAEDSNGSHRGFAVGIYGEVRGSVGFASFESTFVGLPSQLDLDVSGDDEHRRTEYRHTEICLGPELVRGKAVFQSPDERRLSVTPFLGARFSRFVVRDSPLGDGHGEAWTDLIAGARVETRLGSSVVLRLKGDTLVLGQSDEAWRASAAIVFGDGQARAAVGFECHSVDFEGDTGIERVRYDVFLSGPFVAIEVWF